MKKETKQLMAEVSAGIVLYGAALMAVALLLYPRAAVFAGIALGILLALAAFLSMTVSLGGAIRTGSQKVMGIRSVLGAVLRYAVLFPVLFVVVVRFSDMFQPVAVIIGILGLKAGVFLQPLVHRAFDRKRS